MVGKLEQNKEAAQSPLNQAMQELNFDDVSKIFEQSQLTNPPFSFSYNPSGGNSNLRFGKMPHWCNTESVITEERSDKRFIDEAWKMTRFTALSSSLICYSAKAI